MFVPRKILEEKLKQILSEDIGQGDVTTASNYSAKLNGKSNSCS